jgi:hypothetical protein
LNAITSWREEARQDRLTQARIDRDRETARVQARIAERQAAAAVRREAARARAAARDLARAARAARRAARVAWLAGHVVDLLFVPVIVVPGALAWDAMASYGSATWGPLGVVLPLFSEGAMWAFDAAAAIRRHREPNRPIWHLQLGIAVFAGYGAALNFLHGMSPATEHHGLVVAVSMALVSVAGVVAHQLVIAGPRRSRTERDAARIARAAARRELAARRAAVRNAVIDVDEHGGTTLVYEPGRTVLTRRHGRTRLEPASQRAQAVTQAGPACPWPRPAPLMPASGAQSVTGSRPHRAAAPVTAPGRTRMSAPAPAKRRTRNGAPRPVTEAAAEVHFAADLASGSAPSARRIRRELHVGQPRANEIRQHLEQVLAT